MLKRTRKEKNTMALQTYLDFEKPIAELEEKIQELLEFSTDTVDLKTEIARLEKKGREDEGRNIF